MAKLLRTSTDVLDRRCCRTIAPSLLLIDSFTVRSTRILIGDYKHQFSESASLPSSPTLGFNCLKTCQGTSQETNQEYNKTCIKAAAKVESHLSQLSHLSHFCLSFFFIYFIR